MDSIASGLAQAHPESNADAGVMCVPHGQHAVAGIAVVARIEGDLRQAMQDLRGIIRGMDADVPAYDMTTVPEVIRRWLTDDRVLAWFLAVLALLASSPAGIGLYGVMCFSVARRTREIGVRMALGTEAPMIIRLVIRRCLTLSLTGVAIGIAVSIPVALLLA